jgi:hypothetical protein
MLKWDAAFEYGLVFRVIISKPRNLAPLAKVEFLFSSLFVSPDSDPGVN